MCKDKTITPVYANYIGPSVMTDANYEGFPICDDRITENDQCVIKIIGIHCNTYLYQTYHKTNSIHFQGQWSEGKVGKNRNQLVNTIDCWVYLYITCMSIIR